jgi:hypothetical protein
MKSTQIMLIIFLFSTVCFPQEVKTGNKWTRIETDNKEISVSFPPDYLVNNEPENSTKRCQIIGFYKGARMELSIRKSHNSKQNLRNVFVDDEEILAFELNGISGKNYVSKDRRYSNVFFLASDNYFYYILVNTALDRTADVADFIYSIKIKGKPLIIPKIKYDELQNKLVSVLSLKTSPEVLEALNRKSDKTNIKITYQPESALPNSDDDSGKFERPAVILSRPNARPVAEDFGALRLATIGLRISLLANGQVGNVIVFSNAPRSLTRHTTALIRDIKFIPAKINGKYIDSEQVITYKLKFRV